MAVTQEADGERRKTPTAVQRKWLKRRQAIDPLVGHARHDNGMARCWLKGNEIDLLCAAGFNNPLGAARLVFWRRLFVAFFIALPMILPHRLQ